MAQPWGFDHQQPLASSTAKRRYSGITGKSEFALFPHWVDGGWEIQPIQPPAYPRKNQKYAGTKGKSSFAIPKTVIITGTVRDSAGGTTSYSVTVTVG